MLTIGLTGVADRPTAAINAVPANVRLLFSNGSYLGADCRGKPQPEQCGGSLVRLLTVVGLRLLVYGERAGR